MSTEEQEEIHELMEQRRELDEKIEQLRSQARTQAIEKARSLVDTFQLTADDLFKTVRKVRARSASESASGEARYRDPETGKTWTGRGRAPAWLTDKDDPRFKIGAAEEA
ncbi:H-NS histone family protein [Allochromatium humboldtianum]|uniref:H-NS histone family protein n=1 Tax=Allochromatium humboldtianum TaxID=504901 RepID=A0A850RQ88_9GAMM|nr:H-NS histone family protein [Allochromatium humboldtianum]NVZ11671.1 H-NS histone family protein [Allochromatium humboldtianum]